MQFSKFVLLSTVALVATLPVYADGDRCEAVGGVLMTNIGAITAGSINLGPVFGDLAGSVAAQILSANQDGTYSLQHYWVTASGDTILFKVAVLHPTYPVPTDKTIVAVPWGHYSSDISGGTGKFAGAKGTINYFGMADFSKLTLVLRYSGKVCFNSDSFPQ